MSWSAGRKVPYGWEFTAAIPVVGARAKSRHSSIIPYKFFPEGLSGTLRVAVKTDCVVTKKGFVFSRKNSVYY